MQEVGGQRSVPEGRGRCHLGSSAGDPCSLEQDNASHLIPVHCASCDAAL